ncbi:hypothetical protein Bca52824_029693 [Brassica carinata]|uniref:DEK-C domain-containing protein n=1 Tax=Brassica carinata TaxID=52824 RepID=A0A8X7S714_BRACI|nr:hypothetical protein Bca52824_029693 [Brassica carinata]
MVLAHQLSKRKADDNLILLHTILYGKKAKAQMIKKTIGQFSGFVWSQKEEEEKLRGRVKEKLDKCIKEKLIFFCDVLDIPINRSNTKKVSINKMSLIYLFSLFNVLTFVLILSGRSVKVLEFLESPKASRDVILADQEKEAKMRKSTQKKRKSGESSDTPAKRKRQTKKQDQPSDKREGDSDSEGAKDTHEEDDAAPEEDDSDHEKTETEDERDEAEDQKPSNKKTSSKKIEKESSGTKGKDKQASAKISKKSGEKSSKRVAKPTSSPTKKQKVDHEESSKGKSKKQSIKPQAKGSKEKGKASKKGKAEPTREEMLEVVSKMLKEVDFNTATLSDILQKLSGHFGVDLEHRKKGVKGVITDAISEMSDVEDEEEESEAGSDKEKEEEVKAEAGSDKEKEEVDEKLED